MSTRAQIANPNGGPREWAMFMFTLMATPATCCCAGPWTPRHSLPAHGDRRSAQTSLTFFEPPARARILPLATCRISAISICLAGTSWLGVEHFSHIAPRFGVKR